MLILIIAVLAGLVRIDSTSFPGFFNRQWIAYLGQPIENPEIWRASEDGQSREQLTDSGGRVVDFSVSVDGRSIAFSLRNEESGSDVYMMDSDGGGQSRLVACGVDLCQQPAWSPDGKTIAYSRISKLAETGGGLNICRVWMVDTRTGETAPLFADLEIAGTLPVFSPSGDLLAFFESNQKSIRLFDIRSRLSERIPAQVEQMVSFSPDAHQLVFTDLQEDAMPPISALFLMDLETKSIHLLLSEGLTSYDSTEPCWSPDGDWIAFGARASNIGATRQLWIVRPDGSELRWVTADETSSHAAPAWSPDGRKLAFQRLKLGSSDIRPEIVWWDADLDTFTVVAQDGALPAWLR